MVISVGEGENLRGAKSRSLFLIKHGLVCVFFFLQKTWPGIYQKFFFSKIPRKNNINDVFYTLVTKILFSKTNAKIYFY
jgi:hypothetical protein